MGAILLGKLLRRHLVSRKLIWVSCEALLAFNSLTSYVTVLADVANTVAFDANVLVVYGPTEEGVRMLGYRLKGLVSCHCGGLGLLVVAR